MEEIEVKNNPLGIKAFVTNKPSLTAMPKEQFDLFISSLTDYVIEYFNSEKDKDKLKIRSVGNGSRQSTNRKNAALLWLLRIKEK